jgi:hypothetical protein
MSVISGEMQLQYYSRMIMEEAVTAATVRAISNEYNAERDA